VTAGPTREKIDPVRFISNYSTGHVGYEIAQEAGSRGHSVVLVSGPTCLERPRHVRRMIFTECARDMRRTVLREFASSDALIMAAAVCDWRPREAKRRKLKREDYTARQRDGRTFLELVENPDILLEAGRGKGARVVVGFALESEDLIANAREKLEHKNLDLIIANRLSRKKSVFGQREVDFVIIDKGGHLSRYHNLSKCGIARRIIDKVESMCYSNVERNAHARRTSR